MAAFLDAGFQPGDAVRAEAVGPGRVVLTRQDALLDEFSGALSTNGTLRKTVRRFFAQTISRRTALDEPAAERAAELRATRKALRLPDALILATADFNADVVLSADERWLKTSGLNCELRDIASGG